MISRILHNFPVSIISRRPLFVNTF